MGFPWRGTKNAPPYLLNILKKKNAKDLKEMISGTLPPHAVKIATFKKGDTFNLNFHRNDKYVDKLRQKDKHFDILNHPTPIKTWGRISAIRSDFVIEIKCLTHKDRKNQTICNGNDLATLLNLPTAEEQAKLLHLTPPI